MKLILAGIAFSVLATAPSAAELFNQKDLKTIMPIFQETTGRAIAYGNLSSLVVDLNGDGQAELLMRDSGSCVETVTCRIVAAEYKDGWTQIGVFYGHAVELEPGENGYQTIKVQPQWSKKAVGEVSWAWDPSINNYGIDLSPFGYQVEWTDAKEAFVGKEEFLDQILQRSLPRDYWFLQGTKGADDKILIAAMDLNHDDVGEYLVYVQHPQVCEPDCPLFLFKDLNDSHFAKLSAGTSNVVVSDVVQEGRLRAIYARRSDGGANQFMWSIDRARYEEQ